MIHPEIQPGSIFYASWGYDQTNIDFYQVIARTDKMVTARRLRTKHSPAHIMGSYVEPIPNSFLDGDHPYEQAYGKAFKAKLKTLSDGEPCFRVSESATAFPWDGKRKTETYTG